MFTSFAGWLNPLEWLYAVLRAALRMLDPVITLDPLLALLLVIAVYVILQPTLLLVWRGRWRVAAAIPLPFVVLLFWSLATQGTGNLGPIPLLIFLPPAAVYLFILVLLRFGWKAALRLLGHSGTVPSGRQSGSSGAPAARGWISRRWCC